MLRLCVLVTLGAFSACQASPASWNQFSAPVVRAAPAFDEALFSPNNEEPLRNDVSEQGGNTVQGDGPADGTYSFEYDVQGEEGGHSRQESRDAQGTVTGSYTITLADGRRRVVEYIADADGFRAVVNTNEPGTGNSSPAGVKWTSTAGQGTPEPQRPVQPVVPAGGNQPPNPQRPTVRPPTPITDRPSGGSAVLVPVTPVTADEPRSPHHPPQGFVPPSQPSRFFLTPAQSIAVPFAFTARPSVSYLNAYPSGIVHFQAPYPIASRKK